MITLTTLTNALNELRFFDTEPDGSVKCVEVSSGSQTAQLMFVRVKDDWFLFGVNMTTRMEA